MVEPKAQKIPILDRSLLSSIPEPMMIDFVGAISSPGFLHVVKLHKERTTQKAMSFLAEGDVERAQVYAAQSAFWDDLETQINQTINMEN